MSMKDTENCIFDKEKVKAKIENIIGGLKKAGTDAASANNELQNKVLPFIIVRPLPNRTFEYWKLKDLEVY